MSGTWQTRELYALELGVEARWDDIRETGNAKRERGTTGYTNARGFRPPLRQVRKTCRGTDSR